jgi:phage/plasmid-associated DNA primase
MLGMDSTIEYTIQSQTNSHIKHLESFLAAGRYKTPKACRYTNIINQKSGDTYFIPFQNENISLSAMDLSLINSTTEESTNDRSLSILEEHLLESSTRCGVFKTPMEEFFSHIEDARITGLILGFCEQQYFTVPTCKPRAVEAFSPEDLEAIDVDSIVQIAQPVKEDIRSDHSCIELDFDIYQKENKRHISDSQYYALVHSIAGILSEHLSFDSMLHPEGIVDRVGVNSTVRFYAAIIHKPAVVSNDHSDYGKCFKDSFHLRLFLKVSKEYKKYLIETINERNILPSIFSGINILNPITKVLDPSSPSFPSMLLGSAKKTGTVAHEFYLLYRIMCPNWPRGSPILQVLSDFAPLPAPEGVILKKIIDPRDRRRRIERPNYNKYKHNLVYELSLNYEAPGGLIKKREVEPRPEIITLVQSLASRTHNNLISRDELDDVRNHVSDLIVRNFDARFLQKILEILKPERVSNYQSWRDIIIMLAQTHPDYKPLAIWFSHRCPPSWVRGGLEQLETIWEWALQRTGPMPSLPLLDDQMPQPILDPEAGVRTIATLYNWAKEDNPKLYEELQEYNAFTKLHKMVMENSGKLNETQFAKILHLMWGKKFICDENEHSASRSRDRRWYEFVFPEDESAHDMGRAFKWRWEKYPDNLHKYITDKLPTYCKTIKDWIQSRADAETDEDTQAYYASTCKQFSDTIQKLGTCAMIHNILSQCEIEFRDRGFLEHMDKAPTVIGVGNGVLKVYPTTELIRRYHEIPISRSTCVPYIWEKITLDNYKSHPNPYIRFLMTEIRRLFTNDEDAFIFIMCYIANSLDGRKKKPLFFLWLGEGSNGKSFLLEMTIKTLRAVMQGGYAAKLNVSFFTRDAKSTGPDSEKMMLKNARFAYCSESEAGDTLRMGRIKEITSETISGNEKFATQDMFEVFGQFVFCSNNDPRITGRDYGTWRRILVYWFKMKFVDKPDPNNPFEHQLDTKLVDEIPYDQAYLRAYLCILMFFYEMLRDVFHSNLNNIPKPTIDRETKLYQDSQDTVSRFITEQLLFIGLTYPKTQEQIEKNLPPEKVQPIVLSDLAAAYGEWHKRKIDNFGATNQELIRAFKQTRIKKSIHTKFGQDYLIHHRLLTPDEDYESLHTSFSPAAAPTDIAPATTADIAPATTADIAPATTADIAPATTADNIIDDLDELPTN